MAAAVVAACGAVEQRPVERAASRGGRRNDVAISGGVSTLSGLALWARLMDWNCVGTHCDHAQGRYRIGPWVGFGLDAGRGLTTGSLHLGARPRLASDDLRGSSAWYSVESADGARDSFQGLMLGCVRGLMLGSRVGARLWLDGPLVGPGRHTLLGLWTARRAVLWRALVSMPSCWFVPRGSPGARVALFLLTGLVAVCSLWKYYGMQVL